jgi:hypothetical protein
VERWPLDTGRRIKERGHGVRQAVYRERRMSAKLDGKFHGIIAKNKDGSIVPQDQWIVFLAQDDAVPATLRFYHAECKRLGASLEQLHAIDLLIIRASAWRSSNPGKCKVPDVQPGELVT